jgi:hypothetical protein
MAEKSNMADFFVKKKRFFGRATAKLNVLIFLYVVCLYVNSKKKTLRGLKSNQKPLEPKNGI